MVPGRSMGQNLGRKQLIQNKKDGRENESPPILIFNSCIIIVVANYDTVGFVCIQSSTEDECVNPEYE